MAGSNLIVVMALLLFWLPSLWAPGPAANKKGNNAYKKGEYEKALSDYNKAMELLPGERTLSLNAGTALLQQQKYDEALRSLMTAASDPRSPVKSRALYNAGNGLVDTKKLQEALSAYREAILADPKDEDAKFKYELAQRLMAQQQKQQKNNKGGKNSKDQQQQQGGQSQQQKDQQDQQQQQNQQQAQNQPQDQQNPNEQESGDQKQNPPQDQQKQQAGLLSKQEAERLLDALKANEAEMIKARLKSHRRKDVDKDW